MMDKQTREANDAAGTQKLSTVPVCAELIDASDRFRQPELSHVFFGKNDLVMIFLLRQTDSNL